MSGVLRGLEERVVKRVENVLGPKLDKMLVLMKKQNDLLSEVITLLKK
jgi:hypothetical protein